MSRLAGELPRSMAGPFWERREVDCAALSSGILSRVKLMAAMRGVAEQRGLGRAASPSLTIAHLRRSVAVAQNSRGGSRSYSDKRRPHPRDINRLVQRLPGAPGLGRGA